jgi:predicted DNA-binding transcriptional regulator AlpA
MSAPRNRLISLADAITTYGIPLSRERIINLAKRGRFPQPANSRALRLMFVETEIAKWAAAHASRRAQAAE